jgi:hypothetical protein
MVPKGVCPVTAVTMDSMAAQGPRCEICAWTLWSSTDLEQHNSGLVHRTLLESFGWLTLDKFQAFQDVMIFNGHKRGKLQLKQELRGVALQVSLFSEPML